MAQLPLSKRRGRELRWSASEDSRNPNCRTDRDAHATPAKRREVKECALRSIYLRVLLGDLDVSRQMLTCD